MEKCELAAAAADRRLGGIESFVYEIAACEFVDLANYGVDDTYRLETPNPPAAAALYLTGTRAAYDPLAVSARIVYKELCAVGRSALICADAYRYASPPVADAYYELAGRIAAELGDYTYGATPLEAVRTELENVRTLLAQS